MKKLFTFMVAAFAALTINAKEDIDISGIATDGVVTFTGQWQWQGINYGSSDATGADVYADKSAYAYVVVEYTSGTCGDVNLIAQYEKDGTTGQWGPNYYTSTASLSVNPTGGILAVALDPDHSKSLNAVALQNHGTEGNLAVKAAYFASQEEYEAAKAEAGKIEKTKEFEEGKTHTLAAKAWGWDQNWMATDASDFNTLVFDIASITGKAKAAIKGILEDGTDFADELVFDSNEAKVYTYDLSKFKTLNCYAFQNLNKPDGDQYGVNDIEETTIVVNKIYMTNKSADEVTTGINHTFVAPKANINAPIYNLAGQQVSKSYKGVVIQNGKKFVQ